MGVVDNLKKKYAEVSAKVAEANLKYEQKQKSLAESRAMNLEKQASKDMEMLRLLQRQDKARKVSNSLRDYKEKQNKAYSSPSRYSGSSSSDPFGVSSFMPFDSPSSTSRKSKRKNNKNDPFSFLPNI